MARSPMGTGGSTPPQPLARTRSRGRSLLYVILVLALGAAFILIWNRIQTARGGPFAGSWELDDATREWMSRTCIDLIFGDDVSPSVSIERMNGAATLEFNDVKRTRITGRVIRGRITARQLIPTSAVGRFCGPQTTIDIAWRVTGSEPEQLVGRWTTPGCEVCPDRRFRALRLR